MPIFLVWLSRLQWLNLGQALYLGSRPKYFHELQKQLPTQISFIGVCSKISWGFSTVKCRFLPIHFAHETYLWNSHLLFMKCFIRKAKCTKFIFEIHTYATSPVSIIFWIYLSLTLNKITHNPLRKRDTKWYYIEVKFKREFSWKGARVYKWLLEPEVANTLTSASDQSFSKFSFAKVKKN